MAWRRLFEASFLFFQIKALFAFISSKVAEQPPFAARRLESASS